VQDVHNAGARVGQPRSRAWPIKTFKDRDDWIKLLFAVDCATLTHGAKVLASRIALHHNIDTGQCNPSMVMLTAGTGMSERTVRRMLAELTVSGWIRVDRTSGRYRNSYGLIVPATLATDAGVQDGEILATVARVHDVPTLATVASNPSNCCNSTLAPGGR
jgi:hypothetical protein